MQTQTQLFRPNDHVAALHYVIWYVNVSGENKSNDGSIRNLVMATPAKIRDAVLSHQTEFVNRRWFRMEVTTPRIDEWFGHSSGGEKVLLMDNALPEATPRQLAGVTSKTRQASCKIAGVHTYKCLHIPSGNEYTYLFTAAQHALFADPGAVGAVTLQRVKDELLAKWNHMQPHTWKYWEANEPAAALHTSEWKISDIVRTPVNRADGAHMEMISFSAAFQDGAPEHLKNIPFPVGASEVEIIHWIADDFDARFSHANPSL